MPKLAAHVRQARRQRLIDSAWRRASRAGYRDMPVDDVCNEAGLSKDAFYGYVANKQALMLALLDDDASQIDRAIDRLESQALSPTERVQRFTRWMLERGEDATRVQVRADLGAGSVRVPLATDPAGARRAAAGHPARGLGQSRLTMIEPATRSRFLSTAASSCRSSRG